MRIFKKKYKYFDPVTATAGALILGSIVFWINFDHGVGRAAIAAAKQSTYTFLAGGFLMKFCENISRYFSKKALALFLAVLLPSMLAVVLTYIVHTIKGTPEPLNSTIPTMVMAPMGFAWWGVVSRQSAVKSQRSKVKGEIVNNK